MEELPLNHLAYACMYHARFFVAPLLQPQPWLGLVSSALTSIALVRSFPTYICIAMQPASGTCSSCSAVETRLPMVTLHALLALLLDHMFKRGIKRKDYVAVTMLSSPARAPPTLPTRWSTSLTKAGYKVPSTELLKLVSVVYSAHQLNQVCPRQLADELAETAWRRPQGRATLPLSLFSLGWW